MVDASHRSQVCLSVWRYGVFGSLRVQSVVRIHLLVEIDALIQFFNQVFELTFVLNQPADLICASLQSFLELIIFGEDDLLALLAFVDLLPSILEFKHTRVNCLGHRMVLYRSFKLTLQISNDLLLAYYDRV